MLGIKTAIVCDRRTYTFKGKWESPNRDIADNIFYYISQNKTFIEDRSQPRRELVETIKIMVFGNRPIAVEDTIYLDDNTAYRVMAIEHIQKEPNILVRDMLKPILVAQELTLE